jgi:hypothetical protein
MYTPRTVPVESSIMSFTLHSMAMESSSLFSTNFDMVILSLGSVSLYCIDSIAIGEVVAYVLAFVKAKGAVDRCNEVLVRKLKVFLLMIWI